jgi:hypothetical protein
MEHQQQVLKEMLARSLSPVFSNLPFFYSDSPALVEWFKSLDFLAGDFDVARSLPAEQRENVISFSTDFAAMPPYSEWDDLFRSSRLLVIPLASFDPSMEAARYTVRVLAQSQFELSTSLNAKFLKLLLEKEDPFILSGDDIIPAFTVNGTLNVPGVAVAHHRQMHENLRPLATQAWKLFQDLRNQNRFPLSVRIQDSRIVSVLAGDREITGELEYLTNPLRKLMLTEMAFSTNGSLLPENIDWTCNSQLNEGSLGIHVGIGDGLTGAHVDLICPGVLLG